MVASLDAEHATTAVRVIVVTIHDCHADDLDDVPGDGAIDDIGVILMMVLVLILMRLILKGEAEGSGVRVSCPGDPPQKIPGRGLHNAGRWRSA